MDQSDEPLARRLRNAALDRASAGGRRVDDYVLSDDGVIDLQEIERTRGETSIASPAAVLATIRGQLGDAGEVSDLYADPDPERSRWRIGLRARHAFAGTGVDDASSTSASTSTSIPAGPLPATNHHVTAVEPSAVNTRRPVSRLSMVPLSSPEADTDTPSTETSIAPLETGSDAEIDLRDDAQPIAACPRCMSLGQRDLFDRFSQVEYYSCDACSHMWQRDRS